MGGGAGVAGVEGSDSSICDRNEEKGVHVEV